MTISLRPLCVGVKNFQLPKSISTASFRVTSRYFLRNSFQNPGLSASFLRYNSGAKPNNKSEKSISSDSNPPSPDSHSDETVPKENLEKVRAEYELTFTCKPCGTRSTHRISKQGYHYGSVLITCPDCRNRHIISDHLKIFGSRDLTIEDLMQEQGQSVKKGTLSEDGDFEIWADGSRIRRAIK
ncbi:Uncharacterized protein C24H6.02c [Golovinomyces cichoracearum]|uniref:Uncharacterized protein C24H6.02c n=1 Tax=Golovinomyces cichoracearum TaxID=62708 RepID=A0A420IC10_9PEZI|nr:Uncharacterized protein C24H6.02c [Golovinomyces cichoracearum]